MNGVQFLKLIGDARAFRQSAWLIENEISRLQVRQGDLSPVGGSAGWPSHSVWESLKTASHFNLATALELRLKCLLLLHDIVPLQRGSGHCLAKLYRQFGERGGATEGTLKALFRKAIADRPFELLAFLTTDAPNAPEGPGDRMLATLMDVFVYLDEDAELWKKRYAWERTAGDDAQWQHYIDDLGAFFEFLDATESLAMELARKRGIVR
ncbi:MAG: hypothetical protein OXF33_10765 [Rhodospirillales bacterium]|nr:hypothetical protein [Rhodospirillales bacterium]